MLLGLILASLLSLGLTYYFKLTVKYAIITALAILVTFYILGFLTGYEGFADGGNHAREVCYGDSITVWTHKGRFMRMHRDGYIDGSARRSTPDEIPRNWVWEHWIIENADDDRWWSASRTPVKYGDKVFLRSWLVTRMSPQSDQQITSSTKRSEWETLTIESPDINGQDGNTVKYGDIFHIKTWRGMWVSDPEGKYKFEQIKDKDNTTSFHIYDSYGSGQQINWATRGYATQSSIYGKFSASNAIDSYPHTFSHTQSETNAWWQVELPRDINITDITVQNRRDCCKDRIKDFDLIILDHDSKPVYTKHFEKVQDVYTIHNVGRTGRTVKVQLRGKNYLHLANVSVYGNPVGYNTLLETPVSATLLGRESELNEGYTRTLFHESVPYLGRTKAMSISTFIKPDPNNTGTRSVITKGPHFSLLTDNNTPALQIATDQGVNTIKATTGLTPNSWNHVSVVYKPQISPATGWKYGEFISKPNGVPSACCFIVNTVSKEYYHLPVPGPFADAVKEEWKSDFVTGMKYKGELKDNDNTITIYVNGKPDTVQKLGNPPDIGNEPVTIGAVANKTKGLIGALNMVRFYNYSLSDCEALRVSLLQHDSSSMKLTKGIITTKKPTIIPAHMLPGLKNQVSVTFWMLSERPAQGSGEWDIICWKGNKDPESAPGIWFMPKGNKLYSPVKLYDVTSQAGIKEVKAEINTGTWYHVTQVLNGRNQSMYINGKLIDTAELPGDVEYTISPMQIGGFAGKIYNFYLHNYALTQDEIYDFMGRHPESKLHEQVNKQWRDLGCVTDIFDNPSSEPALSVIKAARAGQMDKVNAMLKSLQVEATKGDADKLKLCYGSAAGTLAKMNKTEELLQYTINKNENQGRKCLPIAPFTCKKTNINDYDIRTHKDFHKYVLADDVIPPNLSDQLKQSKVKNSQIKQQLKQHEADTGASPDDIVQDPEYQSLQQQKANEQQKLSDLKSLKKSTKPNGSTTTKPNGKSTRDLAQDIYNQTTGLNEKNVKDILNTKTDLSNDKQYQKMLDQAKQLGDDPNINQHPEYQKLIHKLNTLNHGDITNNGSNYKDFLVQGHKCKTLFKQGKVDIPVCTLVKMFRERATTDPNFKAVMKNIIESTAASDSKFNSILEKAKNQNYTQTPEFQKFLTKITKQQLKTNELYRKTVASLIDSECPKKAKGGVIRIEDHPEYNKYARDMKRQCLEKSEIN